MFEVYNFERISFPPSPRSGRLAQDFPMEGLVQRSFGVNLRIIQMLGFYPPQSHKQLYKAYSWAVYCFCTIPVPILAIFLLFRKHADLEKVADSAFVTCQILSFIVKLFPLINNPDEIRKVIYMVERPIFTSYTKKQAEVITECVDTCKRNCLAFFILGSTAFLHWSVAPLLGNERQLPIEIWLPFDFTTPKAYCLSYICVVIMVGSGTLTSAIIDPLSASLICHATAQLRILKDNLQYLSEHAEEEIPEIVDLIEKDGLKSRIIYDKIKHCAKHHSAIIDFVDNYERVFSPVIFIQFMTSILVICICCLQLSMVEPLTLPFFMTAMFLIIVLMEIYLYCYYGTELFYESDTLTTAIYMGKWYEYDAKSKKALIIFMERSKKPIIITAGKILELSLVTFTTVIRRAYSLLAFLKG